MSNIIYNGIDLAEYDYRVYRLVDGELFGMTAVRYEMINGRLTRVLKSQEELTGYKILKESTSPRPAYTQYETLVRSYTEHADYIEAGYVVQKSPIEEVIQINEVFWASSYFLVEPLLPEELYMSTQTSGTSGGSYLELISSDIAKLESDVAKGISPTISLTSKPDMSVEFTREYIDSLEVQVSGSDIDKVKSIIDFLYEKDFEIRKAPVVIDNA